MAEYVPADVTSFVSISDGARLRRELAQYPIGTWLTKWTLSPELVGAWDALAASAHVSGAELFDTAFGEAFTLVVRGRGAGAEWAIISQVDRDHSNQLLQSLRPRLVGYRQKIPVFDLPEHQLLVSRHDDLLLIGPRGSAQRGLFETVCAALADDLDNPLEDDDAFEQAAAVGGGALFVFVRHAEPAQRHWTAITGSLEGNQLSIRHASSKPMFDVGSLEEIEAWDMAPLTALGEQNVLALIKPVDDGDGPIELFVEEKLGGAEWRAVVRDLKNGRRILVLDESTRAGATVSVAQALELGGDEAHIADLKLVLQGLNADIANLDSGAYLVQSGSLKPVYLASRSVEDYAQDEVSALFRGLPVMEPMPLKWTVAEGPTANWCVMSNDHDTMQAMAEALAAQPEEAPALGSWVSCGAGDGRRLADTIRKLASLGSAGGSISGVPLDQSLAQLTSIAGVVDHFCWTLARTDDGCLTLVVQLKLATGRSNHSAR